MSEIPLIKKRFTNAFAAKGLSDERGKTMKLLNKILLSLGIVGLGIVGVGASAIGNSMLTEVNATTTTAVTADFTTKATSHSSYADSWAYATDWTVTHGANNNAVWAFIRFGGKSKATDKTCSVVNVTAIADDISEIVITSQNVTNNASFTMSNISLTVSASSTFATLIDSVSTVPVSTSMKFVPSTLSSWGADNFYKLSMVWTSTSTSNCGMDIQTIKYNKTVAVVNPTSVTVGAVSTTITQMAGTSQASVTAVQPSGAYEGVSWSSSDSTVASVSVDGLITALNNGMTTIRATSTVAPTVYGEVQITVNAPVTVYDKTINATGLGLGTSYVDGIYQQSNIAFNIYQVMKNATSAALQFRGTPSGYLDNLTGFSSGIKSITIVPNSTNIVSTFDLYVGTVSGSITTLVTKPTVTNVNTDAYVYDIAALGTYSFFKLTRTSASGTFYADAVVVELIDVNVQTARSYATSFISGTAAECTALALTSTTWDNLSTQYAALSAEAKLAFTSEGMAVTVTDIQKTISLYKYVVTKYSYTNFMGITISPSAAISPTVETNQSSVALIVICSLGLIAVAGFFLVTKKHA